MSSRKISLIAMLAALSILFGYVESLIPIIASVPGIKLGISNIVIVFALYKLNKSSAFFIMLVKVFVSSLLFSGMSGFLYSLSGGILSFLIMSLALSLFKNNTFSVIGISMLGGIFHNIGQLSMAAVLLSSINVFCYLPILLISGIFLGSVNGSVCKIVLSRLKKINS